MSTKVRATVEDLLLMCRTQKAELRRGAADYANRHFRRAAVILAQPEDMSKHTAVQYKHRGQCWFLVELPRRESFSPDQPGWVIRSDEFWKGPRLRRVRSESDGTLMGWRRGLGATWRGRSWLGCGPS